MTIIFLEKQTISTCTTQPEFGLNLSCSLPYQCLLPVGLFIPLRFHFHLFLVPYIGDSRNGAAAAPAAATAAAATGIVLMKVVLFSVCGNMVIFCFMT